MKQIKINSLKIFIVLVVILSGIVDFFIIKGNQMMYLVLMWMPALSALIAIIYETIQSNTKFDIKAFIHRLGFRICNIKYILLGILIPLVYLIIPYIIYWSKYPNNFAYSGVPISLIVSDCGPVMFIGIFVSLLSALGEEIGWRGYFVPILNDLFGYKKALVISSLFWCIWHFPLIIGGAYLTDIPLYYQLPMFVLCIFPIGVICGIYALITKSVWPSGFLHAAHNNYDQSVFQIITRGELMYYFVSETGFITIICAWIMMIIVVIRNKKYL